MARYKLLGKTDGTIDNSVIYDSETNSFIPVNDQNYQYREYLEWVAKGNVADVDWTGMRNAKIALAKAYCTDKINAGVLWKGKTVQTDAESQNRITSVAASIAAGVGLPAEFPGWRMKDNSFYVFADTAEFLDMAKAARDYVSGCLYAQYAHVDALRNPATVPDGSALEGYDCTVGYPG